MGSKLKPCKVCKNQVSDDAIVCPSCGSPLPGIKPKDDKKEDKLGSFSKIIYIGIIYLCYLLIKYFIDSSAT